MQIVCVLLICLNNWMLDIGVYITNLIIYIKQYFVRLFIIYLKVIVNDNIVYADKIMPLVFFLRGIKQNLSIKKTV